MSEVDDIAATLAPSHMPRCAAASCGRLVWGRSDEWWPCWTLFRGERWTELGHDESFIGAFCSESCARSSVVDAGIYQMFPPGPSGFPDAIVEIEVE